MSFDLIELEYLVNNHEDCSKSDCTICDRIVRLRNKVGDPRTERYLVTNLDTGHKQKFKAAKDAWEFIGISRGSFYKMADLGTERNSYVVDRLPNKEAIA